MLRAEPLTHVISMTEGQEELEKKPKPTRHRGLHLDGSFFHHAADIHINDARHCREASD